METELKVNGKVIGVFLAGASLLSAYAVAPGGGRGGGVRTTVWDGSPSLSAAQEITIRRLSWRSLLLSPRGLFSSKTLALSTNPAFTGGFCFLLSVPQ